MTIREGEAIPLWPEGAPGARGDSPEDTPRITSYLPGGDGPFACVVVSPGGGYVTRAPHEAEPVARWLVSLGVAGVVLDYRVSPYRHPVPLGDAQRAIRTVRRFARSGDLPVDPARVGILGFSAGGHLAASAATIFDTGDPGAADPVERESSRPDAAVLCYAVMTFLERCHQGSMEALLGPSPSEELRREMSLETRVTPGTPPAFLWHTAADDAVPVRDSLLFAGALAREGVPFELHVFPEGQHGLGLAQGTPAAAWTSLCAEWLAGIGFR